MKGHGENYTTLFLFFQYNYLSIIPYNNTLHPHCMNISSNLKFFWLIKAKDFSQLCSLTWVKIIKYTI